MERSKNSLISVIIPVYNVEKYIQKAVQSVLTQTYRNIELILIDDGSCDKSGNICDEIAKNDDRVTVVHKANGGVSSSRNIGMQLCHGEYIHFLDADDWIESNCYEVMLGNMIPNDVDVGFFGWSKDTPSGNTVSYTGGCYEGFGNQDDILSCILTRVGKKSGYKSYGNYVWNKIYRKESLFSASGELSLFSEDIAVAEDGVWLVETGRYWKKGFFYNAPLYHYYQNPNSVMNSQEKYCLTRLESQKSHIRMLDILKTYNKKAFELHRNVCTILFFDQMKNSSTYDVSFATTVLNNIITINDNRIPESIAYEILGLLEVVDSFPKGSKELIKMTVKSIFNSSKNVVKICKLMAFRKF